MIKALPKFYAFTIQQIARVKHETEFLQLLYLMELASVVLAAIFLITALRINRRHYLMD